VKLTPLEAGNYYRGLLLLIRKDNKVTEEEYFHLKSIGKILGFEKLFCETAINDILENQHISKAPPLFSKIKLAKKFISDGFYIACCDNDLHPKEEQWLRAVADKNGIEEDWFLKEKKRCEWLQKIIIEKIIL
jgi:hypothetical protein